MKYFIVILLMVVLSGCNTTTPTKKNNVIIADGTEAKQFEDMVFCGDAKKFTTVVGGVGTHLTKAWDSVLGEDNKQECTIRIKADSKGLIYSHSVVTCENEAALPSVLEAASPVLVPDGECFQDGMNRIKYALNSNK